MKILPEDFELLMAKLAVAERQPPSTHARVLAELIRCSTGGIVERAIQANAQLPGYLDISKENYKAAIRKLTALKLIERDGSIIRLKGLATTPCSHILIQRLE